MNMDFERKLAIPMEVKAMYPATPEVTSLVERRREALRRIFTGEDDRLVLIVGPCSADNEDSVLEYASRLARLQETVQDKLFLVPRVYTGKPRTSGDGYKGLLHQPNPMEKPDLLRGIITIRELHIRVVRETGFISADEMLYPENYKYLDDVLGYVAVGARSVENQQHRLTASGIEVPTGMKNPTSGDLSVMMNAIHTAQGCHTFIYRGWEAHSHGNPLSHAILRGYVNRHGEMLPNYHYEDLTRLAELYASSQLQNPALIVDASHANSGKDPFEQPRIVGEVLSSCRQNAEIKRLVKGFMLESYLEDGAQPIGGGTFGKSITDACLGWEKTERLILSVADSL